MLITFKHTPSQHLDWSFMKNWVPWPSQVVHHINSQRFSLNRLLKVPRYLDSPPANSVAGSCAVDTNTRPVQEEKEGWHKGTDSHMFYGVLVFCDRIHHIVLWTQIYIFKHSSLFYYCWKKLLGWLGNPQLRKGGEKNTQAIFQGQEGSCEGEEGQGIGIHTNPKCTWWLRRRGVWAAQL